MPRAIGVDVGDHSIKVVELTGNARSFKVQRVAIRPIPEDAEADDAIVAEIREGDETEEAPPKPSRDERVAEAIAGIFREFALPKEDVCAALRARTSMIREINVPFFEDDQIRKVVRFEAENHLHSQSIDDVVINWVKTGATKDGSRLTVFASPKDRLAELIAVLRRGGVDPSAVDLDSTAVYTALDAAGIFTAHPTCVVLHVGATSTNLVLVVEGRPRVFRAFPLGTGTLERTIARETEGIRHAPRRDDLFVRAGDLPAPPGTPETAKSLVQHATDLVADEREAFVQKLHREVIRSLAAVRTETPPDRLLLTGGGALVEGVAESLATRFGLPVERLDILEHIPAKDRGPDPVYAGAALTPAIGCALRMLGRNPLRIELLQDEFAPRNAFDVIRTALATFLTLGFLAIAFLTWSAKQELVAEKIKFNDRLAVAKHIFRGAEGLYLRQVDSLSDQESDQRVQRQLAQWEGEPSAVKRIASHLIRRLDFLRDQMGLSERIPQLPSALEAMTAVYQALGPAESQFPYLRINKMQIRATNLSLTVFADSNETVEKVRELLAASPYVKERATGRGATVEAGSLAREGDYFRQEFTINFREDD